MADAVRKVNVDIETKVLAPHDPFFQDANLQVLEAASMDFWNSLDDEHQKGLLVLVLAALGHLHVDPASWVPSSLIVEPEGAVQVVMTVKLGQIHEEIVAMRLHAEERMLENRDDIARMRQELILPPKDPDAE